MHLTQILLPQGGGPFVDPEDVHAPINFINAARIQLKSDDSSGVKKHIFNFFSILGVRKVALNKGYGIAYYDVARAQKGLHPMTPIDAVWIEAGSGSYAPTPTPSPPALGVRVLGYQPH